MRPLRLTLAALLLAATPAAAEPPAPDVRRHVAGTAEAFVRATDGAVYRLGVYASVVTAESTTSYSWLRLEVGKCVRGTCAKPVRYVTELTPAQYDVTDLRAWSVRLTAFGAPFVVTWRGDGPGERPTDVIAFGTEAHASGGWRAAATVTALGRTCAARGAGSAHGTSVYATGFARPTAAPPPAGVPATHPRAATACRTGP